MQINSEGRGGGGSGKLMEKCGGIMNGGRLNSACVFLDEI